MEPTRYRRCKAVSRVQYKPKIRKLPREEAPGSGTRQLLSKAQLLMSDIEKLLDWCGPTMQREIQPECQASSVEEDGETLVIEGSRFESVVSREDLSRHLSDGYLSGFITQSQQGLLTLFFKLKAAFASRQLIEVDTPILVVPGTLDLKVINPYLLLSELCR
ncbi:hypothetical protein NQZ68_018650, partial [Dissostichus eleginoides]